MELPPALPLIVWPTRLVAVVATLRGYKDVQREKWHRNTSTLTFVIYQRVDALGPNYVANFAFESGVFVHFIQTYYDNLPDQTIFMQDGPEMHNRNWEWWASCIRPTTRYAPMVPSRMERWRPNGQTLDTRHVYDGVVEQCWRNLLDAFNLGHLLPPRVLKRVGYFPGNFFVASKEQLRRHPRAAYVRAHRLQAGSGGRCHVGPLEWSRLASPRTNDSVDYDAPIALGKHTEAGAFELLQTAIIGGMSFRDPFRFDYCSAFRHKINESCPNSPCPRVRPMAHWYFEPRPGWDSEKDRHLLMREALGRKSRGSASALSIV